MGKYKELLIQIDEMIEQGMTPKFISAVLGIPYPVVLEMYEERCNLEEQKNQQGEGL